MAYLLSQKIKINKIKIPTRERIKWKIDISFMVIIAKNFIKTVLLTTYLNNIMMLIVFFNVLYKKIIILFSVISISNYNLVIKTKSTKSSVVR